MGVNNYSSIWNSIHTPHTLHTCQSPLLQDTPHTLPTHKRPLIMSSFFLRREDLDLDLPSFVLQKNVGFKVGQQFDKGYE